MIHRRFKTMRSAKIIQTRHNARPKTIDFDLIKARESKTHAFSVY